MKSNINPTDMVPDIDEFNALLYEFGQRNLQEDKEMLSEQIQDSDSGSVSDKETDVIPAIDVLMEMEGLEAVKDAIQKQLSYAKIMNIRKNLGFKTPGRIFNVLLTGNPGSGKTTVARLIGQIFHQAGLLSKGHTVETNRASLVGRYIGDTEANTSAKIEEARGGVLLIDEMYALTSEASDLGADSRDFGIKVIDTLMPVLSDPNSDIIVIGCGYRENMSRFMKANPGLASRFPMVLDFPDFTEEQLWSIISKRLGEFDFSVSEEAEAAIRKVTLQAMKVKNFGNARFAVTLVEDHIIPGICGRILSGWNKEAVNASGMRKMSVVLPDDVPALKDLFPLAEATSRGVGFK